LALNNVYCANTHPPSVILGLSHGSYGVGGIVAPIIGTAIVSQGILWSRFYFLTVGLRLCCIAFAAWSFWSYTEDSEETLLETTTSRQTAAEDAASKMKNLKLALKNKVTIFGALFIFAYQGAEVSISGWFISYLINYRNGDPAKVGYVTAGFWVCILAAYCVASANCRIGRHHAWSFCTHSRCAQDRREEICRHPHSRHHSSSTSGMVDTKFDRKCSRCLLVGLVAGPRLPVCADHLLAPHASSYSDHRNRIHWWSRKLRWCGCALHNWCSRAGFR